MKSNSLFAVVLHLTPNHVVGGLIAWHGDGEFFFLCLILSKL